MFKRLLVLGLLLLLPVFAFAQGPTAGTIGAGSGGITSVSSLPATCTLGTQVSLTINGTAYGIFTCGGIGLPANTWVPDNPTQSVSPLAYGAKWDVKYVYDAGFTNTSQTVTCPN